MSAKLSVNEIFRALPNPAPVGTHLAKVLEHLAACRTGRWGYTLWQCADCARLERLPNGCGDRHCPTCQHARTEDWLERQRADLLPVRYYHWVFTLPAQLRPLALQNPKELYRLLFDAAGQTLLELGRERFQGATLGVTLVLHTWGQNLSFHPHVHGLVTGGGLTPDGQWSGPQQARFLLPVHQVGARFRQKFLSGLLRLFTEDNLAFHGPLAPLADPEAFHRWLATLPAKRWNVFAKGSVVGPDAVLDYLGRYTHRVALANGRLLAFDPLTGRVSFRYQDYRDHQSKVMILEGPEFLRRWTQHVLPPGFTKIRHYGLLGPNQRAKLIPLARTALENAPHRWQPALPPPPKPPRPAPICPYCGSDSYQCVALQDAQGKEMRRFVILFPELIDSS